MYKSGAYLFFESHEDFVSECKQDPWGRGYTVYRGCNNYPISYPSKFPAAFAFKPDLDPHCIGSFVQKDFYIACSSAILGLESEIKRAEKEIEQLRALKNWLQ